MRNPLRLSVLLSSLWVGFSASAEEVYFAGDGEQVRVLETFQDCAVCPEMIVLPLGTFQMGSSVEEANAAGLRFRLNTNRDPSNYRTKLREAFLKLGIDPDQPAAGLIEYYESGNVVREDDPIYSANGFLKEVPRHRVLIDLPIAMGRNEVTREEWAACVEDGGCEQGQSVIPVSEYVACEKTRGCVPTPDSRVAFRIQKQPLSQHPLDPRHPRVGVTYYEMQDYVSWLNTKVGAALYRLPTEAEWEYAAKAGTNTRFAQGDTLTLDQANFAISRLEVVDGEYVWEYDPRNARRLLPVDDLNAANDWGLRHMSGNASEFTSTCGAGPHRTLSTSSSYLEADRDRPDCRRSIKGGFYLTNVEMARPARRVDSPSEHWSSWLGFRVVRDLEPIRDAPGLDLSKSEKETADIGAAAAKANFVPLCRH
jgi:formylglycine-generating enzyme required for sulfatase activity